MKYERSEPFVPETLDGWALLHEMYSIDWPAWNSLAKDKRTHHIDEATAYFSKLSFRPDFGETALISLMGHKGDLMLIHMRRKFDDLNAAELAFKQLGLYGFLRPTSSYLSVVELGLYEMTAKLHRDLLDSGVKPDTDEWTEKWRQGMDEQRERMKARLYPEIPKHRYVCFYPMNKFRGEEKNWYAETMDRRQRMMRDHGMIGRKYTGQVTQLISGSIGYDDWEWGVDLFTQDPLVFKRLIYEMRFDEASAFYGVFGPFYFGLQFPPAELANLFEGNVPKQFQ